MTKLHRAGFFISFFPVVLAFIGFCIAGIIEDIDFHSQYFWIFIVLPLILAAAVTGLSWKWSIIGGSVGIISPFFICFTFEMETLYRYLFTAGIILYFSGGVLLLIDALKVRYY